MDENIVQVNSMMSNLRNMAIDMGNEIENQNQLIDRVNKKVIFVFLESNKMPFSIITRTKRIIQRFKLTHSVLGRP
jgi:synaptosomal-associated protein 23